MEVVTSKMIEFATISETCVKIIRGAYLRDYFNDENYYKPEGERYQALNHALDTFANFISSLASEARRGVEDERTVFHRALTRFGEVAAAIQRNPHIGIKDINPHLIAFARLACTIDFPSYYEPDPVVLALEPYRWAHSRTDRHLKIHFFATGLQANRDARVSVRGNQWDGRIEANVISVELPSDVELKTGPIDVSVELPTSDWLSFLRDDWTELKTNILVEDPQPFSVRITQFGPWSEDFWEGIQHLNLKDGDDRPEQHQHGDERLESRLFVVDGKRRLVKCVKMERGQRLEIELASDWSVAEIDSTYRSCDEIRQAKRSFRRGGAPFVGAGWTAKGEGASLVIEVLDI